MGSPQFDTWLVIESISSDKMELSDRSVYKFLLGKPEGWIKKDRVKIKKDINTERDGAMGKKFTESLTATKEKTGKTTPVALDESFNPPDQPSEVKKFNTLADVEFGKKYHIEEIDSKFNITVGSQKFTLNPLSVNGTVDSIDWEPGDVIIFSKSVSRNEYNFTVENLKRQEGKNPKLSYYFPKE